MKIQGITIVIALLSLLSCTPSVKKTDNRSLAANRNYDASCFYNGLVLQSLAEAYRADLKTEVITNIKTSLDKIIHNNPHFMKLNSDAYTEMANNQNVSPLRLGTKYYLRCAKKYRRLDRRASNRCMKVSYIQRLSYIAKKTGVSKNRFMSEIITQTGYTNTRGIENLSRLVGIIYNTPSNTSVFSQIYATFNLCRESVSSQQFETS